ncbi:MAG: hypothetical protein ACYSU0_09810 [Planctomycetota bacterium]
MSHRGLARLALLAALLAPGRGAWCQVDARGGSDPVVEAISVLRDSYLTGRDAPGVIQSIATIRRSRDRRGLAALVEAIAYRAPSSPGAPRRPEGRQRHPGEAYAAMPAIIEFGEAAVDPIIDALCADRVTLQREFFLLQALGAIMGAHRSVSRLEWVTREQDREVRLRLGGSVGRFRDTCEVICWIPGGRGGQRFVGSVPEALQGWRRAGRRTPGIESVASGKVSVNVFQMSITEFARRLTETSGVRICVEELEQPARIAGLESDPVACAAQAGCINLHAENMRLGDILDFLVNRMAPRYAWSYDEATSTVTIYPRPTPRLAVPPDWEARTRLLGREVTITTKDPGTPMRIQVPWLSYMYGKLEVRACRKAYRGIVASVDREWICLVPTKGSRIAVFRRRGAPTAFCLREMRFYAPETGEEFRVSGGGAWLAVPWQRVDGLEVEGQRWPGSSLPRTR